MVVVCLEPVFRFMDRCGLGTSTRKVAQRLWGKQIPGGDPAQRVRELYAAENQGRPEPSGSQDMAGLVYPGVNRLDYDAAYADGYFPVHVESNCDSQVARWLEHVLYLLPIAPRPPGYHPLGSFTPDSTWIQRLGQTGQDCYAAIQAQDVRGLGASFNECMRCWQAILPHTVQHPTLTIDLVSLLSFYQARYWGAMYSGCGGGYLIVASEKPVPGGLQIQVRTQHPGGDR